MNRRRPPPRLDSLSPAAREAAVRARRALGDRRATPNVPWIAALTGANRREIGEVSNGRRHRKCERFTVNFEIKRNVSRDRTQIQLPKCSGSESRAVGGIPISSTYEPGEFHGWAQGV